MNIAKRTALLLIRIYQRAHIFISPAPHCRFIPSCSEYTRQAIDKYGIIGGSRLGMKRLLKCHPFHSGGYDPL
jgi:uncharacterized protein